MTPADRRSTAERDADGGDEIATDSTAPDGATDSTAAVDATTDPTAAVATEPTVTDGAPDWLVLGDDEAIRWQDGPRIQTVYPWIGLAVLGIGGIGAAVAFGVVSVLGFLWLPIVATPACWQYARVSRTVFLLTNRRVAIRSGVFGVRVRVVGLDRIQNTTVSEDVVGRLVGYGRVRIETAGGSEVVFWNVENAPAVRSRLDANRNAATSTGVPGTRDQWGTVLDEVREWRRALDRSSR